MMSISLNKLVLYLSLILAFILFIGINGNDIDNDNHHLLNNQRENLLENIRWINKRRFLPTRREFYRYANMDDSDETDDNEEQSHLNAKRYFLKSKRYFLNSKREDED